MKYQNILLIDDDEDDQEIFLSAIEQVSDSVNCTVLDDARQALKKLLAQDLTPDVIFLDLNMPRMTGQEFLAEIKRQDTLKNIPVIIFSTSAHSGTILHTKELGAENFITKPGKFDELVNILSPMIHS